MDIKMDINVNSVNPNKLFDELVSNGIMPLSARNDRQEGQTICENMWITFSDDVNATLIQQIIDAHDPKPLPKPLSEIEQLRLDQAQANAELFEMMLMLTGGAV